MTRRQRYLLFAVLCMGLATSAMGAEPLAPPDAVPGAVTLDSVTLKDGTVIYGQVLGMVADELHIKTNFGPTAGEDIIKIMWPNVAKISVNRPIPFMLKEGTTVVGTAQPGEPGTMILKAAPTGIPMAIPFDSVLGMNQPAVIYTGAIQAGFSQTTGNSHLRNGSLLGELSARSESLRLTILGRYIYGDNGGNLIVRNSRGTIKLDFFLTKRLYWFASAYFEQDTFQDLKLRTALSTGPGYQLLDRGDLTGIFKDMTLWAEAGAAYFNEDFKLADDKSSTRGRWAVKWNWPLWGADQVSLYHFQEGFQSLANSKDLYLTADTGLRFKVWGGLVSGFQWTMRYNKNPPAGISDTDNLYLITLGYSFDTSRKQ
jgi:putative salt-induced outer membrane protein YdiY